MGDNRKNKRGATPGLVEKPLSSKSKPAQSTDAAEVSTPKSRLSQLAGQLESSKTQSSTNKGNHTHVLNNLKTLHHLAANPQPKTALHRSQSRQRQAGKLWVRDRITALVDQNSFVELGAAAGTVTWTTANPKTAEEETPTAFTPSNNLQGFATLTPPSSSSSPTKPKPRRILLTADDFSIRAGHADGALASKTEEVEKLAVSLRVPIVKLVDGSSGGGSVTFIRENGWSYVPRVSFLRDVVKGLDLGVPNLGAVVGVAVGLGAARVTLCHFSVMAANIGSLINAGPAVVANATFEEGLSVTDLGGPLVHCTNGTIDNIAADETECYTQIRTVLGYLPNWGGEVAPVIPCSDPVVRKTGEAKEMGDLALRSIIPARKARMYNARTIITTVVDRDSWFEIGRLWGTTGITGLARLDGRPVGIISMNCEVNGGALDAAGSQKLTRMLKFCDVFNLPIVQFVDIPGYAIGTAAERSGTMRWGVELAKAYQTTTTPLFNVITRRVFGVAGAVMVDARDPAMQVAWPSGQWGSLPLEGGIEVAHAAELRALEKSEGIEARKKRYNDLEKEYTRLMNPVRTANSSFLDIIDPKDTRAICCGWVEHVYEVLMAQRVADRMAGRISPRFG